MAEKDHYKKLKQKNLSKVDFGSLVREGSVKKGGMVVVVGLMLE